MEKIMQNLKPLKNHAVYSAILAAILLAGCATSHEPTAELAVSRAAVADAIAAGANQVAPLDLASARDKIMAAERAIDEKNYDTARTLAMQAETDAKLAESKANAAKAERTADIVQNDIRALREELARQPR
jgi:outer membrane PBP1 activator LpoA protein